MNIKQLYESNEISSDPSGDLMAITSADDMATALRYLKAGETLYLFMVDTSPKKRSFLGSLGAIALGAAAYTFGADVVDNFFNE